MENEDCYLAVVSHDSKGKVVAGNVVASSALSPLEIEAKALSEAHVLASTLGIKEVKFESDNLNLVLACKELKIN